MKAVSGGRGKRIHSVKIVIWYGLFEDSFQFYCLFLPNTPADISDRSVRKPVL